MQNRKRKGGAPNQGIGSQFAIALVPTIMAVVMSFEMSLVMTTIRLKRLDIGLKEIGKITREQFEETKHSLSVSDASSANEHAYH